MSRKPPAALLRAQGVPFLALAWAFFLFVKVFKSPYTMLLEFEELFRQQQISPGDLSYLGHLAIQSVVPLTKLTGILGTGWAVGDLLFDREALPERASQALVKLAIGLGCLSLLLATMGALHLFSRPFFAVLWYGGVLVFAWRIHKNRAACWKGVRWIAASLTGNEGTLIAWMGWGLVVIGGVEFFLCLVPEVVYDPLMYHLAEPRLYLLHGGLVPLPWTVYSQFPQAIEMLYAWCLGLFPNETLPKLLHWSLAWATTLCAALLAARWESKRAGWLAAWIWASTPVVFLNTSEAMIDFGVAFFGVTSFLVLEGWLENRVNTDKALLWAGFLAGMALGCKYTGVYVVAALEVLVLVSAGKRTGVGLGVLRAGALFGACALIGSSPWLLKNLWLQGNPLSPFACSLLGHSGLTAEAFGRMRGDMPSRLAEPTLWGWLRLPWLLSTEGKDWHHWLGPVYLLLAGIHFLERPRRPLSWAWLFLGLYAMAWSLQTHVVRFFFPALAVAAALWGSGAEQAFRRGRPGSLLWGALLAGSFFLNTEEALSYYLYQHQPLPFLCGKETRADFLSKPLPFLYPSPSHATLAWANTHLPADSTILFIGETRAFSSERKYIAPSPWNTHPLIDWIRHSATDQDLWTHVQAARLTHVLFNEAEWYRVGIEQQWLSLTDRDWALFNQFWKAHVRETYRRGEAELFEMNAAPAPSGASNPIMEAYWKFQTAPWKAQERTEQARRFVQLGKDHPDITVPCAWFAQQALLQNQPDQALKSLGLCPATSEETVFFRGAALVQKGRWLEAEAILAPLALRRPDIPLVAQQLAIAKAHAPLGK